MSINVLSIRDLLALIAHQSKIRRLNLNLSQKSLSERAGVSYGVLKKFERTGKISLESLLKLSVVLDCSHQFESLFKVDLTTMPYLTLDQLLQDNTRKRGRK
jgi:transcriptional regulator with XRE-family HTH domain